ncbi:AAA family ATPase, partial [Methylomagnum sp.]
LLDEYKIKLDATYKDMAVNFDFPELINPPKLEVIQDLEVALGGYLALEGRKLVFVEKDGYKMETPLLAEGIRKLAMLPYFIRHGLIKMKGETLFWDEPETNLNPRLISKLAEALVILARKGVQIILATHSLFLLKEIDLQLQLAGETSKVPSRFFALSFGDDGVQVSSGNNLVDIDPITALDVEIDQSDRYNEWYYRASRAK